MQEIAWAHCITGILACVAWSATTGCVADAAARRTSESYPVLVANECMSLLPTCSMISNAVHVKRFLFSLSALLNVVLISGNLMRKRFWSVEALLRFAGLATWREALHATPLTTRVTTPFMAR